MNWYLEVLKQYTVFTGRARRQEYWMFTLTNFVIMLGIVLIETAIGLPGIISTLYALAVLLPAIGVSIRRLHDTSRTGWWLLLVLIPYVGAIILLVLMALDSTPGENQYGPNPKEAGTPEPADPTPPA